VEVVHAEIADRPGAARRIASPAVRRHEYERPRPRRHDETHGRFYQGAEKLRNALAFGATAVYTRSRCVRSSSSSRVSPPRRALPRRRGRTSIS
jgi:hypothetical protein